MTRADDAVSRAEAELATAAAADLISDVRKSAAGAAVARAEVARASITSPALEGAGKRYPARARPKMDEQDDAGKVVPPPPPPAPPPPPQEAEGAAKATAIQTLIFDKEVFRTEAEVRSWVMEHDFRVEASEAEKGGIDETDGSFRVRQRPPSDFVDGSLRTIQITDGVQAVVGQLAEGKAAKSAWCADDVSASGEVVESRKCEFCGSCAGGGGCGGQRVRLVPVDKAAPEADSHIVFGIAAEPNEVDTQGDTERPDTISRAAHLWLARFQNRGLMHKELVNEKVEIFESYVAPEDMTINGQRVKKGSWLLMLHVLDDALWERIKSGELTGFSIGGYARRVDLRSGQAAA